MPQKKTEKNSVINIADDAAYNHSAIFEIQIN